MDAERLLGSLMTGSVRRSMPGKAALGMGLLGVAIAAFEHYREQGQAAAPAPGGPPPGPPSAPPPPPRAVTAGPPPPPPATDDSVLLIRAMIAAAAADGAVDAGERARIVTRVASSGVGAAEREFLERELAAPRPIGELVAGVASPALAEQVYTVSLLAIDLDAGSERSYLRELARGLALDEPAVTRLHRLVGVPLP